MKKTAIYCIILTIIAITACSSPKKVKSDNDTAAQESSQTSQNNNTDKMTKVLLKTTFGGIIIALYDDTPEHKANFEKLVSNHFYDGLLFHRIIKGFMIQGGDPNSKTAKAGQHLGNGDVGDRDRKSVV